MFKKPLIHFFSLLLLITFTQISLTEESDKSEETDKEVTDAQKEEKKLKTLNLQKDLFRFIKTQKLVLCISKLKKTN